MSQEELRETLNNLFYESRNIKGTFYYDETNNFRKLSITETGLNNNLYDSNFVLGGLSTINGRSKVDIKKLINILKPQQNMKEFKFKYFSYKQTQFEDILNSKRLNKLFNWIHESNIIIHFDIVNYLYYSIVDIVDSCNFSEIIIMYNRALKNDLYNIIKDDIHSFLHLFYRYQYPNIKKEEAQDFLRELIYLYENKLNEIDDNSISHFSKELLRQILVSTKENPNLIFLHENEDNILFEKYESIYFMTAVRFPEVKHVYDEELLIKEKIKNFDRPDISIWSGDEVVAIIECKTQLGWSRNSWESDFINREKKLKESFPKAKAYLLVMTSSNWGGFGSNKHVGTKYFTLSNIWPSEINDNYEDSIINPIEPLFKSIAMANDD